MTTRFVMDGVNGRVSVYTGNKDTALEANPLSDLARVKFSSQLDYVGFEQVTKTISIPAIGTNSFRTERVLLGPHGRNYTPIVIPVLRGWPNASGTPTDIVLGARTLLEYRRQRPDDSGVLRGRFTDFPGNPLPAAWRQQRSWVVGAGTTDTELYVIYDQLVGFEAADGYPATDLTIDFYVGNRSIDGSGPSIPTKLVGRDGEATIISGNGAVVVPGGRSAVSSEFRYMQQTGPMTPNLSLPLDSASLGSYILGGGGIQKQAVVNFAANWQWDLAQNTFTSSGADPVELQNQYFSFAL